MIPTGFRSPLRSPTPEILNPLRGALIGVAAAVGGALVRVPVAAILGTSLPYITFLPAVALAAWAASVPGALAAIVASVALVLAFVTGTGPASPVDSLGLALFIVAGVITGALGGQLHRARHAAERSQARTAFLAHASRVLHADLDRSAILSGLTRCAVPAFADWCSVDLFDPDGTAAEPIVQTMDPARADLVRQLRRDYPPRPTDTMGIGHVFVTGEPEHVLRVPPGFLTVIRDGRLRAIMEGLGLRSFISVPIQAREDRRHGVLTIVMSESGRTFDASDLEIALDLGRRVAVALDQADLYAEAQRRRDELDDVVRLLTDAALVAGADGLVSTVNPAAVRLLGDVVGQSLDDVLERLEPVLAAAAPGVRTVPGTGRYVVPIVAVRAHGPRRLRIALLRDVTDVIETQAARDTFIGMLSHELRTPITTIYGGTAILRRTVGEHPAAELLGDLVGEADRLHRLVEDLLVLARFEQGQLRVTAEPVLVQRVVARILARSAEDHPGIQVAMHAEPDVPPALGDATYVEQVLRNLVSNAIKYAGEAARIEVSVGRVGDRVLIRFEDDGPGIPEEERERIFRLYERLGSTAGKPGAGIGLFVSRHLIEAMGGSIRAGSGSGAGAAVGGGGACFEITLPLEAMGEDADEDADALPAGDGGAHEGAGARASRLAGEAAGEDSWAPGAVSHSAAVPVRAAHGERAL